MFIYKTRNIKNLNDFQDDAKALISKIEYVAKFGEDNLRFTLTEELTPEEIASLDNLVNNFSDEDPELKIPKILALAKAEASSKHFHNIDYKKELTTSLIPVRNIVQGEVNQVLWYKTLEPDTVSPTDLILKVDIVYTRDETGFATNRVTTRTWINEDETENIETKITNKFYFINPSDMITEGYKRRKLLVQSIQIPTLTFMTEVLAPLGYSSEAVVFKGRKFMDEYEDEFNKFVDNSSTITDPSNEDVGVKTIVVIMRDESNSEYVEWLDKAPASLGGTTTIRQYLIGEFSI